jgi:hypothetical protein
VEPGERCRSHHVLTIVPVWLNCAGITIAEYERQRGFQAHKFVMMIEWMETFARHRRRLIVADGDSAIRNLDVEVLGTLHLRNTGI